MNSKVKAVTKFRLISAVLLGVLLLLGAGDDSTRIDRLGHQLMCVCSCNQILLECNHVGCSYSSRMRGELVAAVDAGNSDGEVLQTFIQKYGTTVLAAPTMLGWVNRSAWIMPYAALVLRNPACRLHRPSLEKPPAVGDRGRTDSGGWRRTRPLPRPGPQGD